MLIHLSEIMNREGKTFQTEATVEMNSMEFKLGSFPIRERTPITFTIVNVGKRVLEISGSGDLKIGIPCGRCLEEVLVDFPLDIHRKVDMKLSAEDRIKDLDESNYITGMDLDTDRLVCDEILIQWPLKVLCKEDCKGICSKCGQNLNHGTCDCEKDSLDPRMAAISDIFNKFKEV